jgi:hypothetical protein
MRSTLLKNILEDTNDTRIPIRMFDTHTLTLIRDFIVHRHNLPDIENLQFIIALSYFGFDDASAKLIDRMYGLYKKVPVFKRQRN